MNFGKSTQSWGHDYIEVLECIHSPPEFHSLLPTPGHAPPLFMAQGSHNWCSPNLSEFSRISQMWNCRLGNHLCLMENGALRFIHILVWINNQFFSALNAISLGGYTTFYLYIHKWWMLGCGWSQYECWHASFCEPCSPPYWMGIKEGGEWVPL